MRIIIKKLIEKVIASISSSRIGSFINQQFINNAMKRIRTIHYRSSNMHFTIPNRLNTYRVDTFATKEPDTLLWIDSMRPQSVFWDIGANIGLYSIYASKAKNCSVYAFEPSVFNLELLARNIYLNRLQKQIIIIPLALNDSAGPNTFKMTTTDWGGALSTFAYNFDQHGNQFKEVFEYQTMGLTMSDSLSFFKLRQPEYIKIDVDGLEHIILRGGNDILKNVKSVLVEINDDFFSQANETVNCLLSAGLELYKKSNLGMRNFHNQWWIKQKP